MKIGRHGRKDPETCTHATTIAVTATGIERIICESCGHVSVRFLDDLISEAERDAFAREADDSTEPGRRGRGLRKARFGFTTSKA